MTEKNTFKKEERLCSKKEFDNLLDSPCVLHSSLYRLMWKVADNSQPRENIPCQIALAVPKRTFKHAVDRNTVKRRSREAYRQHKHSLLQLLATHNLQLRMLFVYTKKNIKTQEEITDCVVHLLRKVENEITKNRNAARDSDLAAENAAPVAH